MSDLRATNYKGRTSGSVPNLPDGVVVGSAVTINSTGVNMVGVITATTINANSYIGVAPGFSELDAALFN